MTLALTRYENSKHWGLQEWPIASRDHTYWSFAIYPTSAQVDSNEPNCPYAGGCLLLLVNKEAFSALT